MATTPFKDSELARFVSKRILELRPKSQTEIAAEAMRKHRTYGLF